MNNDEQNCSNHLSSTDVVSTFKQDENTYFQFDALRTDDELSECYVLGYN
ncbi:hypothetical protein RGQ13_18485 [Thalassotalea psychrophila]|uniref:Uncharacterized protein n=1 Tax=Thalassotalea psychrophila TaxID=3065647 RepID=A0ABY9TU58_9GAMM|nr:hypothetical protein RGQ13_18485 [Colwelliaceae bacterium SQ149]